jgi:predicted deacetylase
VEGDEILLHGCEHRLVRRPSSRFEALHIRALSRGEGEFANLDEGEAAVRLRRGRAILEACGLRASGFVAPGYLLSLAARRAVAAAGFTHVPQLFSLWEPPRSRTRFAPAVFFDPQSALIRRLTFACSALVLQVLARHTILRVVIHPPDLRCYPRTAAARRAALSLALRTRTPRTYRSIVAP